MTDAENPYESPVASPSNTPSSTPPPTAGSIAPPPAEPRDVETNNDARTFAMLCHLTALASLVGVPFGNILGPLVMWLVKKNDFAFVDEQGKESLNFQITVIIALAICIPLIFIIIGIFLALAVGITSLIFVIIAAVKTSNGEHYRYPISLRLIK
ncbi:MAG: DUF4870 domain-containing protein [Phycisphaerae bacterium]|nr:DUF4870 domain-containing protein [Phycisphaerae bacterium]